MRSFSQTLLLCFPALLAVLLLALSAVPLTALHVSLTPNVVWLMTLVVSSLYPPAWPLWLAFALGLLQDIVFATPLGAQALLALLLVILLRGPMAGKAHKPFQLRWLEAAVILVLLHLVLWALMALVQPFAPAFTPLLVAGLVSACWYPLFDGVMRRLLRPAVPLGVRR